MPGSTIAIEGHLLVFINNYWQVLTHSPDYTQIPASFLSHVHLICCMLQIEFVMNTSRCFAVCSFLRGWLPIMLNVWVLKLTLPLLPPRNIVWVFSFLETTIGLLFESPQSASVSPHLMTV